MSGAKEIAAKAVENIEGLLKDMFIGDYANNEVSLGVLLDGKTEIQVQLKVTRSSFEFIETDYDNWEENFKPIDESLKQELCDHDWEDMGDYKQCTYPECQKTQQKSNEG